MGNSDLTYRKHSLTKEGTKVALAIMAIAASSSVFAQQAAPKVPAVNIQSQAVTPYHDFIGRTYSPNDVTLYSQALGQITKVNFEDGAVVKKGDLMYQIDPRPYKAAVDAASANVESAKAALALATINEKRAKKLLQTNSASQLDVDEAVTQRKAAKAAVDLAQANLTTAKVSLSYTSIVAPFTGVAGYTQVDQGDMITPTGAPAPTRLVDFVSPSVLDFRFEVDEKLMKNLQGVLEDNLEGNGKIDIALTLSNGKTYQRNGQIHAIGNRVDIASGSVEVAARFKNPDFQLRAGEYAHAVIKLLDKTHQGILIPQTTVLQNQRGPYVFTVVDGKVTQTFVKLGQLFGKNQEVISGLKNGDVMITRGLQKLRPGMTVQPVTNTSK